MCVLFIDDVCVLIDTLLLYFCVICCEYGVINIVILAGVFVPGTDDDTYVCWVVGGVCGFDVDGCVYVLDG